MDPSKSVSGQMKDLGQVTEDLKEVVSLLEMKSPNYCITVQMRRFNKVMNVS